MAADARGGLRARRTEELDQAESWRLLASASLGRVVFTMHALPAIRPVNHLVEAQMIIVRSHLGTAITAHAGDDGAVVCYEVDDIDPVTHTGWSVIATGAAKLVRDTAAVTRYRQLLDPWVAGDLDQIIVITPQIITGIRLATL